MARQARQHRAARVQPYLRGDMPAALGEDHAGHLGGVTLKHAHALPRLEGPCDRKIVARSRDAKGADHVQRCGADPGQVPLEHMPAHAGHISTEHSCWLQLTEMQSHIVESAALQLCALA